MNKQTPPLKQVKGSLCRQCKWHILYHAQLMLAETCQTEMALNITTPHLAPGEGLN